MTVSAPARATSGPALGGSSAAPVAGPPRGTVPPAALLSGLAGLGVAVLALWWLTTPSVSGLAGWLTESGRVTGLAAGYLAAALLLLMARVPAIDAGVGTGRLARWHATGGRWRCWRAASTPGA